MSIKNILVAYNGTDAADKALRYASVLAGTSKAHVTGLLAHAASETFASASRWISPKTREIIEQAQNDVLDEIETRFRELAKTIPSDVWLHWLREPGRPDAIVANLARSYDFVFMGWQEPGADDARLLLNPDKIALRSGRPLLIVPASAADKPRHEHAVLAWDGRRAAARALSDSMQILKSTALVSILTVGDESLPRPVSDLELHLERHGIRSEHVHLDVPDAVAEAILGFCKERDPDLLVMGAYEHSKFREDFAGGVTATVLRECPLPVLMSH